MWLWLGLAWAAELRLDCSGGTYIANSAYQGNKTFDSLYLDDCLEVIGSYAFENTNIASVRLPKNLNNIMSYAFQNTKLTSVVIPEGTVTLSDSCFAKCTSLMNITIPSTVTTMGPGCFTLAPGSIEFVVSSANKCFEWHDGILIQNKNTIKFAANRFTELIIPSGITVLAQSSCQLLSSVISIDARYVVRFESYAFRSNKNMVNITFGSKLTSPWTTSAFTTCDSLTDVFIVGTNPNFVAKDGIVYQKSGSSLSICYLPPMKDVTTFVIPKDMTSINAAAFQGTKVQEFKLEEGHTKLACHTGVIYSTSYVTVHACPPQINKTIFEWHPNVQYIAQKAFYGQMTLGEIVIPEGVVRIGPQGFATAQGITGVVLPESLTEFSNNCFHEVQAKSLVIPSKITVLKRFMCGWMLSMETVEIKGNITTIEDSVFADCRILRSINLPASIETIGIESFYNNWALTLESVNFSEGLEFIGRSAFQGCTSLDGNLIIPSTVAIVDTMAFYMCSSLDSVTIVNCNTDVREKAFYSSDNTVIKTVCIMTKTFTMAVEVPSSVHHYDVLRLGAGIIACYLHM